jgi:hypothetical protein
VIRWSYKFRVLRKPHQVGDINVNCCIRPEAVIPYRSMGPAAPAIEELLACTHGRIVLIEFTSQQLEACAEFMV